MKTEDFERLKAICEKEGFEITNMNNSLDGHELGVIAFAQKKKERVEVEYGYYSLPFHEKYILAVHFAIDNPNRMDEKAWQFLAKQLEKYLNGEIE